MLKTAIKRLTAAVAATLVGFGTAQAQPTKIDFQLDWSLYGTHAPFFLAQEKHLYEKAGLDVTISEGTGSATATKLVARGSRQLGFVDFGTMAKGAQRGLPVEAVTRIISDVMVVISKADDPIDSPKELEGKVIAYAPSESTAQVIPALYKLNDVDLSKVSIIQPASGAKLALFLRGNADAIPGYVNIQVAQAEAKGARTHYFKYSDYGVSLMNNGLIVNTDFAEAHPEAVKAFVKATIQAFEMAEDNPEMAVDALIARNPDQKRNRDLLLRQWKLTVPALKTAATADEPFGTMAKDDWQSTVETLQQYGDLKSDLDIDTLYTNEYLPEADE